MNKNEMNLCVFVCVGSEQCCLHHGQSALPQTGGEESAGISSLVGSPLINSPLISAGLAVNMMVDHGEDSAPPAGHNASPQLYQCSS